MSEPVCKGNQTPVHSGGIITLQLIFEVLTARIWTGEILILA